MVTVPRIFLIRASQTSKTTCYAFGLKLAFSSLLMRERETWVCCSTYLCIIGWFLCVLSLGIEPTALLYWDNALTNGATPPGPESDLLELLINWDITQWIREHKHLSTERTWCLSLFREREPLSDRLTISEWSHGGSPQYWEWFISLKPSLV